MLYTIGLIGLAVAWLLPGHYYPWTSFHQEALAAAGVWVVGLAAGVTARSQHMRVPFPACVAFALALVPLIQWATGLVAFFSDALLSSAALCAFGLSVMTGASLTKEQPRFVGATFAMLGLAASLSVGFGLMQWLQLGPYDFVEQINRGDRIVANLLQPNHLACLLAMALAAALWAYETRRIGAVGATLSLGFLGFGLVMTQSRAAWLFAVFFVALWAMYRRRIPLRSPGWSVLVGVVAFALAVISWPTLNAAVNDTVWAQSLPERMQQGYRFTHFLTIADALLRAPWFGYGWQPLSLAQQAATLDHAATGEWLLSSHNQWLDLLIWCGIPLGLAVTGAIGWWAAKRVRQCNDPESWALVGALGVLFTHSMVEFPLQYAYFLLPAGLLVGSLDARLAPAGDRAEWRVSRAAFLAALLGMGTLLFSVVSEYFAIEEGVRRVRLRDAGYVQSGSPPTVPNALLLDQPREYLRMWVGTPNDRLSPAELAWLRKVALRTPSPPALMRLAVAEGLSGNSSESARTLQLRCHIMLEKHCDQGRKQWAELRTKYPELSGISYPPTPYR